MEEEVLEAWEVWDVVQRQARDGHLYTTLRHATMGMAVELWHDSLGGFYLYTPSPTEESDCAPSVYCCFSNGIAVLEDALCAPELVLELCKYGSRWQDGSWIRDQDHEIGTDGLSVKNRSGERTWVVQRNGKADVLNGGSASNCIVVSHCSARTQIILIHKGVIFMGSDPLLIPHPPEGRLRDPRRGASDPLLLQLHETVKGVQWEQQWDSQGGSSKCWEWFGGGKGWVEPPIGDAWMSRVVNRTSVIAQFEQGNQPYREMWVGSERGPGAQSHGVLDYGWRRGQGESSARRDRGRWCGAFSRWSKTGDEAEGRGGGGYVSVVRDGGPLEVLVPGRAPLRRLMHSTHALRTPHGTKGGGDPANALSGEEEAGAQFKRWCLSKAKSREVESEALSHVLFAAAMHGWHEVWARVDEDEDEDEEGERTERVVWAWPWNDRKVDVNARSSSGQTALMHACFNQDVRFAVCLLLRGADVDTTDQRRQTALYYAINHSDADADPSNTQRASELLLLLLSFGASVDVADDAGVSPVMSAACSCKLEAVRTLLQAGARPFGRDRTGFTLMDTLRSQRAWATSSEVRARMDAVMEEVSKAMRDFDGSKHVRPPKPLPASLRKLAAARSPRAEPREADDRQSTDRVEGSEEAEGMWPEEEIVGTVLCSFGGVGVCWLGRSLVEEELRGVCDRQRRAETRPEAAHPTSIKITQLKAGMHVRVAGREGGGGDEEVDGVLTRVKGGRVVVDVGHGSRNRQRAEQEHDKHRVIKVLVTDKWVPVHLEVPQGCVSLSCEEGLELLAKAEAAGTSLYARLLPVWSKQMSPTSCGACCALLARSHLAPETHQWPTDGTTTMALEASEGSPAPYTEKTLMQECPKLVPGVDPTTLWRRGLTLNQVAALCRSLLPDWFDARPLFCSDGATVEQFRAHLKGSLAPTAHRCVIANFYMGARENGGIGSEFEMGHHSPVGAYEERSDMVLIMDVWYQSADAYWVHLPVLWEGMQRGLKEAWGNGHVSDKSRGYLLVGKVHQHTKSPRKEK